MSLLTLFLVSLGVSADAFAVALGKGLQMRRLRIGDALAIAVTFGVFQALMPLLGWLLGTSLRDYITEIDHWIAFGLLGAIGGKMLWEAFQADEEGEASDLGLPLSELLLLGVATFAVSLAGVVIGHRAGVRFRRPAEIAGGLILILIGLRILLTHLGIL